MKKKGQQNRLRLNALCALGTLGLVLGLCSISSAIPKMGLRRVLHSASQPTEVLVKFRPGSRHDRRTLSAAGYTAAQSLENLDVHVVKTSPNQSIEALTSDLKARYGSDLAYVEPNRVRYAVATPDDPFLSLEYHITKINAPEAWDVTSGNGVT